MWVRNFSPNYCDSWQGRHGSPKQGDFKCRQPPIHTGGPLHSSHMTRILAHTPTSVTNRRWPSWMCYQGISHLMMHYRRRIWQSSLIRWGFPSVNAYPQQLESELMFPLFEESAEMQVHCRPHEIESWFRVHQPRRCGDQAVEANHKQEQARHPSTCQNTNHYIRGQTIAILFCKRKGEQKC